MSRLRRLQLPIRLRLTIWYTLSLGIFMLLFTLFIYLQVMGSLLDQVDSSLNLAANQALLTVSGTDGQLTFQAADQNPDALRNLSDDFVIWLMAADGTIWDTISNEDQKPQFAFHSAGFQTQFAEGEPWRVYRQAVADGSLSGWIQVAQELDPLTATLANLGAQMFWGLPLALVLAGIGGYFLALRALRPIAGITRTAQAITANDFDQRLNYNGPLDEVGRLARTFDDMLDRLQSAFRRERRFTGDAAHELRTPLSALKGQIGVTLSKSRPAEAYQDTLQEMEGQVDRLIRLSNDLLFMARLDQEQVPHLVEKIDLTDLMAAVIDQIRPLAGAKAITLSEEITGGLTLQGDLELLIRLFLNLLDNAVKYTPQNGRITIHAQQHNQEIQINISDTGQGIAAEHLPHLFDRFYRVEGHRSRLLGNAAEGGSGLGLAIAHDITRLHGGQLSVASEPGLGSTFTIQLPILKSVSSIS